MGAWYGARSHPEKQLEVWVEGCYGFAVSSFFRPTVVPKLTVPQPRSH